MVMHIAFLAITDNKLELIHEAITAVDTINTPICCRCAAACPSSTV